MNEWAWCWWQINAQYILRDLDKFKIGMMCPFASQNRVMPHTDLVSNIVRTAFLPGSGSVFLASDHQKHSQPVLCYHANSE